VIELRGPAQLLVLVDNGKVDRARLGKSDDVHGIETAQAGVLPAEKVGLRFAADPALPATHAAGCDSSR